MRRNAGSGSTSRLFMRLTSPSTCSRSFDCDSATTTRFSRSFAAVIALRSRTMLCVAEIISRCCCESASTCMLPPPPPPPPPPPIDMAERNCSSSLRMRMK